MNRPGTRPRICCARSAESIERPSDAWPASTCSVDRSKWHKMRIPDKTPSGHISIEVDTYTDKALQNAHTHQPIDAHVRQIRHREAQCARHKIAEPEYEFGAVSLSQDATRNLKEPVRHVECAEHLALVDLVPVEFGGVGHSFLKLRPSRHCTRVVPLGAGQMYALNIPECRASYQSSLRWNSMCR